MRKKIGIYECMWLILGRPSKPLTQKTILDDLEGQGHKCNPSNNQFIHLLQSLNCDKQIGNCQKKDHQQTLSIYFIKYTVCVTQSD